MRKPGVSAGVAVTTTLGSRAAAPASSVIGVLYHHRDGTCWSWRTLIHLARLFSVLLSRLLSP